MQYHFEILRVTRNNALNLMNGLSDEQLITIPKGFNNNILWNIAHMVVVQQLLIYRLSGLDLHVSEEFVLKYKKDSKPEGEYTKGDIAEVKSLLLSTVDKLEEDYNKGIFKEYKTYTTSYNITLNSSEEAIKFNNTHEGLHLGYAMAQRKLV